MEDSGVGAVEDHFQVQCLDHSHRQPQPRRTVFRAAAQPRIRRVRHSDRRFCNDQLHELWTSSPQRLGQQSRRPAALRRGFVMGGAYCRRRSRPAPQSRHQASVSTRSQPFTIPKVRRTVLLHPTAYQVLTTAPTTAKGALANLRFPSTRDIRGVRRPIQWPRAIPPTAAIHISTAAGRTARGHSVPNSHSCHHLFLRVLPISAPNSRRAPALDG